MAGKCGKILEEIVGSRTLGTIGLTGVSNPTLIVDNQRKKPFV
jgi:hypothetical protein